MKRYKYVVQLNGVRFASKSTAKDEKDLIDRILMMYGKSSHLLKIREL